MSNVLNTAWSIYQKSVLKALPLTITLSLVYLFIQIGQMGFSKETVHLHFPISLILGIFSLPLIGVLFFQMEKLSQHQGANLKTLFVLACSKFLSLMGCLISMSLYPLIVFVVGISVCIALDMYKAPHTVVIIVFILTALSVFASIISRIFAPILVFTNDCDANSSLDQSEALVKGAFLSTYIYSLFALCLLALFVTLPNIILYFIPGLPLDAIARALISAGLLALLGPLSLGILLSLKGIAKK